MTVLLDAGAFIAIERGDRHIHNVIAREARGGRRVFTHGGVVGQVWRGQSGRQARVARVLHGVDVVSIDLDLGRAAGELLGRAGTNDVIDAALVVIARDGDEVWTSDPGDIAHLATVASRHLQIVPVR